MHRRSEVLDCQDPLSDPCLEDIGLRDIGFIPLPLTCVVLRILTHELPSSIFLSLSTVVPALVGLSLLKMAVHLYVVTLSVQSFSSHRQKTQ